MPSVCVLYLHWCGEKNPFYPVTNTLSYWKIMWTSGRLKWLPMAITQTQSISHGQELNATWQLYLKLSLKRWWNLQYATNYTLLFYVIDVPRTIIECWFEKGRCMLFAKLQIKGILFLYYTSSICESSQRNVISKEGSRFISV